MIYNINYVSIIVKEPEGRRTGLKEHLLAYAVDKISGKVVDFVIGNRTKGILHILIDNLLSYGVRKIRTGKLTLYQKLIPQKTHYYIACAINHIERKNLSTRTRI